MPGGRPECVECDRDRMEMMYVIVIEMALEITVVVERTVVVVLLLVLPGEANDWCCGDRVPGKNEAQ